MTFLGYIEQSDIILDSFPFGGCNSSLECFFLNKPIITLPSDHINGRFTYGFYQKMGITDCIATSLDHYIELALHYGTNMEQRKEVIHKIKTNKMCLFNDTQSQIEWEETIRKLVFKRK